MRDGSLQEGCEGFSLRTWFDIGIEWYHEDYWDDYLDDLCSLLDLSVTLVIYCCSGCGPAS